jgi:UDPglucose 6-dehydrogenase
MPLKILQAVEDVNQTQKSILLNKITKRFGHDLTDKHFALWGLAFKPGTDDVREAPALTIIDMLLDAGAQVIGHDPQGQVNFSREIGSKKGLTYVDNAYDAVKNADALILVTEWPEYKRPNFEKISTLMRSKNVFDLRNQWSFKNLKALGYHYQCIGRPDALMARDLKA